MTLRSLLAAALVIYTLSSAAVLLVVGAWTFGEFLAFMLGLP